MKVNDKSVSGQGLRTLILHVDSGGNVYAAWTFLSNGDFTWGKIAEPITNENATQVYADLFSRMAFDFICPRVWGYDTLRRRHGTNYHDWVSLLRVAHNEQAQGDLREMEAVAR